MTPRTAPPVFIICGRDPLRTAGGSESYAVAHARAAMLAGYAPHLFSIAPHGETLETDFGTLHRVASPVRPPRSITCVLQRHWLVPAVFRTVEAVCAGEPGMPRVIHALGAWSDTTVAVADRLRQTGVAVAPVATVFTSIEEETRAKLQSMVVREHLPWRLYHRLEHEGVRRIAAPVERRALHSIRAVVVNYDSVAAQLTAHYGSGLPIRRLAYSPATAFRDGLRGVARDDRPGATARIRRPRGAADRVGQPPRRPQGA